MIERVTFALVHPKNKKVYKGKQGRMLPLATILYRLWGGRLRYCSLLIPFFNDTKN